MTTALPMLSAAGAVKAFGQSVNNLLRHNVFAANDSAAMQKVRDIQMSKALWENGSMEEMILTDHSRDILGNFRTDTKAETNDKLQHLKDLGLDASGIQKEVLRRRAVLEAARRQRETEADARAAQEIDQTRGREDISTNPYAGQRANMSAVKKVIGGMVDVFKGWGSANKNGDHEFAESDYKQFKGDWKDRNLFTSSSKISAIGCVLTTYANMTGRTPEEVDSILDNLGNEAGKHRGGYGGQRPDLKKWVPDLGENAMLIANFATKLNMDLEIVEGNDELLRTTLDNNVQLKIRSEIRFSNHSVMLSGARYDRSGNLTHYLIKDPGRTVNKPIRRDSLRHKEWGKIEKIRWLYE